MIKPVPAPLLGIEQRETWQQPGHSWMDCNVTFSGGARRPRAGLRANGSSVRAYDGPIVVLPDGFGTTVSMVAGCDSSNVPYAEMFDEQGTSLGSVDLRTLGEPERKYPEMGVLKCRLGGIPTALLTTPTSTYVWQPSQGVTTLRQVDMTNDTVQIGSSGGVYWVTVPHGRAHTHNNVTYWYSMPNRLITLSGTLPTAQSDVAEQEVSETNRAQAWHPENAVAFSDPNDPFGIFASAGFFVNVGERVMGIQSYREELVVFTDKSIYVLSGDPFNYLQSPLVKVHSDRGAACWSVVEAADSLFFLSDDGLYRYAPGGEATNLTDRLPTLWNGEPGQRVPNEIQSTLESTLKWPWRIDKKRLAHSYGCHLADEGEVWFTVPVGAEGDWITLVYAYGNDALSVSVWDSLERMCSGHDTANGKALFATGNGTASLVESQLDYVAADKGVPVIFCSPRLEAGYEEQFSFRRVWTRLRLFGKETTTTPTWFAEGSMAAWDVEQEGAANSSRQETSGNLVLHPDTANSYFLGTFELGTDKLTDRGWFTSRIDPGSVRDKWACWGYLDFDSTDSRPPVVEMQSYAYEVNPGGGNR